MTNLALDFLPCTWSSQIQWNRSFLEAHFWWLHLWRHQHVGEWGQESAAWKKKQIGYKTVFWSDLAQSQTNRGALSWYHVIAKMRCFFKLNCCSLYLNLGPMAATCLFRLLLGPPTLKDRDLCRMAVKISTWSALLYLAISNLCTRNWKVNRGN